MHPLLANNADIYFTPNQMSTAASSLPRPSFLPNGGTNLNNVDSFAQPYKERNGNCEHYYETELICNEEKCVHVWQHNNNAIQVVK